ncbi:hypothetical protein ABGB07_02105 [Micromonosporaceae bacterium B7E4]
MSDNLSPATRDLIARVEAAVPTQQTPEFTRYAEGLVCVSVCTSLPDDAATARINLMPPMGDRGEWVLSEAAEFADGSPHPNPCDINPQTHRHLLFEW